MDHISIKIGGVSCQAVDMRYPRNQAGWREICMLAGLRWAEEPKYLLSLVALYRVILYDILLVA